MLETRAVYKHCCEFAIKGANASWKPVQFTSQSTLPLISIIFLKKFLPTEFPA